MKNRILPLISVVISLFGCSTFNFDYKQFDASARPSVEGVELMAPLEDAEKGFYDSDLKLRTSSTTGDAVLASDMKAVGRIIVSCSHELQSTGDANEKQEAECRKKVHAMIVEKAKESGAALVLLHSFHQYSNGTESLKTVAVHYWGKSVREEQYATAYTGHYVTAATLYCVPAGSDTKKLYRSISRGHFCISPDGKRVVTSVGSKDSIVVWDLASGGVVKTIGTGSPKAYGQPVVFGLDGNWVVYVDRELGPRGFNILTGEAKAFAKNVSKGSYDFTITRLFPRPNGSGLTWLAEGSDSIMDFSYKYGDYSSATGYWRPTCAAYSLDYKKIAVGNHTSSSPIVPLLTVRAVLSSDKPMQLPGYTDRITSVAFSPDARYIATASRDMTIRIWDANTGAPVSMMKTDKRCESVAFSPDGSAVASGEWDEIVRIRSLKTGALISEIPVHTICGNLAYALDGRALVVANYIGFSLYDARTGERIRVY